MHEIFNPGFPGLLEALYVQERILERMMPSVYDVFVGPLALIRSLKRFTFHAPTFKKKRLALTHPQKQYSIASSSYATKWYITLFANSVPFQTQLRLWDAFFLEGRDLIIIFAIGIIWVCKGPSSYYPLSPPQVGILTLTDGQIICSRPKRHSSRFYPSSRRSLSWRTKMRSWTGYARRCETAACGGIWTGGGRSGRTKSRMGRIKTRCYSAPPPLWVKGTSTVNS